MPTKLGLVWHKVRFMVRFGQTNNGILQLVIYGNSLCGWCTFVRIISAHVMRYYSVGSDRSASARDGSTMEGKGDNKDLEYIFF